MAQAIRRAVPAVIQKAAVKPLVKAAVKATVKATDGFQVMDISNIEFLSSGRGGGKPMDPAVARLIDKAVTLQVGQGIKVPVSMRLERQITGKNGVTSVLHTYKGAQTLSKRSTASLDTDAPMRFRTRRDTANNLWLFRVEPIVVTAVAEAEAEAEE
jgi:hypothetical protein